MLPRTRTVYHTWLVDLVFPIRCIGCRRFDPKGPSRYLCGTCASAIPICGSGECIGCTEPSKIGATCEQCRTGLALDQLLASARFQDPLVQSILKTLKYQFVPDMAAACHFVLKKYLKALHAKSNWSPLDKLPLIVPVPLTRQRLNWRGFNQAELIAKGVADAFQLELHTGLLGRIKNTIPQVELSGPDERQKNVSGIFRCTQPDQIAGRNILLIDDVCTTGATLNECARVLKASGARFVSALVVARG